MSDQQIKAPQPAPVLDQEAEKNNAIVGKKLQSIFRQVKTLYALQYTKTDKYPNEIIPHLYLGSVGAALSKDVLIELKIKYVLTAMDEMKQPFPDIINEYKIIRVKDSKTESIQSYFDESNEFINKAISQGENILVHCFAGVSRSATFVIAYIMKYCNKSFEEALKIVKNSRSVVNPNPNFVGQLKKYEEILKQNQEEGNKDTIVVEGDNKNSNVEGQENIEKKENTSEDDMKQNSQEQNEQDDKSNNIVEVKDTVESQLDKKQNEEESIQKEESTNEKEEEKEVDVVEEKEKENVEEQVAEKVEAVEETDNSQNQLKEEEKQTVLDSKINEENIQKVEESETQKEEISQNNQNDQNINSKQVEVASNNNEGDKVENKTLEEQTGEKEQLNEVDGNQEKDNQKNEEEQKIMEQSEEGVTNAEKDLEVAKKKKNQKKRRR